MAAKRWKTALANRPAAGSTGFLAANAGKLSFLLAVSLVFLLIPLEAILKHNLLSFAFMLVFASTFACTARQLVVGARLARGHGIVAVFYSALGIAALQACGITACGAAGIGILSLLVPGAVLHIFSEYSVPLIAISMAAMLVSLRAMDCLSARAMVDALKN